jgi:hypothetical protein
LWIMNDLDANMMTSPQLMDPRMRP